MITPYGSNPSTFFLGERGIWSSSRKHPVCSFHPRLRVARRIHAPDFFPARLTP